MHETTRESAIDLKSSENFTKISGFTVKTSDRAIFEPTVDPAFYVSPDRKEMLDVVGTLAKVSPQNVLLTGPQGCGKTELAIWFAAKYGKPCIIMNCATIRETKDWFGYRDAKAGTLSWHKSDFVRAIEAGNVVVVLDEFNRLHTTLHNSIYPLLDARRCTYVEEIGEMIQVGKGTVFIATANIGVAHVGTHTLDSAIEDDTLVANDLAGFLAGHPTIRHIFFNGAKAESCFRRHIKLAWPEREMAFTRLPSTSPAHAGRSFEQKLAAWRTVANALAD